ncbi:HlyD family secretion protein [Neorhodopirellula lusitana]|uniref:HlyD family secretion protein n=1 Tax=Neorhodopirellula lusitana TaxID=445327 RepID=A0ABY1QF61_9BACT|nr:HlyD family efflux transporter periplasmic adaptor subunit [Neorhodopirellula lusitana]SMP69563.1 HlyD family secretion protein [Neorhodopirellula lusitana]
MAVKEEFSSVQRMEMVSQVVRLQRDAALSGFARVGAVVLLGIGMLASVVGCRDSGPALARELPRPVSVMELTLSMPDTNFVASGRVKSWKTEAIGFEVPGRIDWVLEPGKNVAGRIEDADGRVIDAGTPLARLDPDRYIVAVESAKAQLEVARRDQIVAEIRIDESLPASIESVRSDMKLAEIELERARQLKRQNAISEAEYDAASNRLTTARTQVSAVKAELKQADAELQSAKARVSVAVQAVNDAERDLADTTLHGAYRGQISKVDVVPGSVVSAGTPVLTLQMMDPIKVELEVSDEVSRELQRRHQVPVSFTDARGVRQTVPGMIHVIDPSADSATRTFTVTLLILNSQYSPQLPAQVRDRVVAMTEDIWPLDINSIIGVSALSRDAGSQPEPGLHLVEEDAIETDDEGSFVWLISNSRLRDPLPEVLQLERQRVELMDLRVPYLGNWVFRQVRFLNKDLPGDSVLAGELKFASPEDREQWSQTDAVYTSGPQWLLRPGDLVQVNLGESDNTPGLRVPAEAIVEESGKTFVVRVEKSGEGWVARKIEVTLPDTGMLDSSALMRIASDELKEGDQIVVGGVHYLDDGEAVAISSTETRRQQHLGGSL